MYLMSLCARLYKILKACYKEMSLTPGIQKIFHPGCVQNTPMMMMMMMMMTLSE